MNSHPVTLFLHIPKAGGTSLSSVIWRQYRGDKYYDVYGGNPRLRVAELAKMDESRRRQIACVAGHFGYGIHEIFKGNYRYVTMLRDPVDRVISSYYYIMTRPNNWLYKEVTEKKMSLLDYIRSTGIARCEVNNLQTRMLAGLNTPLEVNSEHAEKAICNLRNSFDLVGVIERFDDFLLAARRKYGWKNILYIRKNERTSELQKTEVSELIREEIKATCKFDQLVYDEAKIIFNEQFTESVKFPSVERALFKCANTLYDRVQKMKQNI